MSYLHRGAFNQFLSRQTNSLNESRSRTRMFSYNAIRSGSGPMVFVSHKHSDLEKYGDDNEVQGLINFLIEEYNVIPYIDCFDPKMPQKTCAETADRIKAAISYSNRFILLGTDVALASKWCNWEVGIADKTKYTDGTMAIMPMLNKGQREEEYQGNEYLRLYPKIIGEMVSGEYRLFVVYPDTGNKVSLGRWLGVPLFG